MLQLAQTDLPTNQQTGQKQYVPHYYRLIMGPCIVETDRIVIKYVQYQIEVNQCRNEEFIGSPGLVMGPCIDEIDHIVIRDVQYQFEVNQCRNEEVIVKGNFGWAWSMWAGVPQVDIDRIVKRDFIKGNFGWAWSMWAGAPKVEIDRIVIRDVQYQFEVNLCRNEEVNNSKTQFWGAPGLVMGSCIVEIDRTVIRDVQYEFEVNRLRNEEFQGSSAYRRTERRTAEITTISPRFSKSVGIMRNFLIKDKKAGRRAGPPSILA
ncbi:hypothetical protein DPMN_052586 [Dreissena polymorpha]|uniref:Uncharacterized protein n=1 Tax=Dreissena polymorpha TaxID=45954 RepID=A0A9D4HN52_DREPO|nr:hypothetical protein DPMN_052586 [Dreissena polymorpha]